MEYQLYLEPCGYMTHQQVLLRWQTLQFVQFISAAWENSAGGGGWQCHAIVGDHVATVTRSGFFLSIWKTREYVWWNSAKRSSNAAGKSNYVDFGENYLQTSCLCPAAGAAGQVEKVSGDDEISTRLEPVQKSRLFYRSISQAYFRIIKFSTKQTSV